MIEVLVVDDDFMVARIHTKFLEQIEGFRVIGAEHTGAGTITAVRERRPDLVLLDLYLPDAFGLDLLAQMRAGGYDGDVIVITAAKELDAVRRASRQGVVDYLLKPFKFDELRQRLERYAATTHQHPDGEAMSQQDVDRVLARRAAVAPRAPLPKGLSPETAQLVERALHDRAGSLSAGECGEEVGLSRVSARRYLEHLCNTGKVDVKLRYGTTGRPERRYTWVR